MPLRNYGSIILMKQISISESEILSKIFEGNLPPFDDPNVKWRMINIARWEKVHHVSID